ncbi:MAG: SGNH/GDSL hydrolase family protein [Bythopirellula sp.]|nr:SGNH/GDSL hydrolase family protein [Bythopirellula sp.]
MVFSYIGQNAVLGQATQTAEPTTEFRSYAYEVKPDDEAFRKFNPRKAPQPGELLLKQGDRLAICGDSITEQKMYSRIIETYLTACVPQLEITARQYGWSGEKTGGFLKRMEQDCLRFEPTVATLCYGMNDSRYRPFDVTNGMWYEDHYRAIVRKFKEAGARVVVGSPGCAGKTAAWVDSRSGTLDEHNENLCALRDIALDIAETEGVAFADVFWPMYQAQVFAPGQHGATAEKPYNVAGKDGIHPDWAGHVVMAYAFLRGMGLDGQIADFNIDMKSGEAKASEGHEIKPLGEGKFQLVSSRYPYCARGALNEDNSIRSGMTLVPFTEDLNRFMLQVTGLSAGNYLLTWGEASQEFSADELAKGINLAEAFAENPFSAAFDRVDEAVAAKQKYETKQIKEIFHGAAGKANLEQAAVETEAERTPLADAIESAMVPVTHQITIAPVLP